MVAIRQQIANRGNFGSLRALSHVLWIVIHYTANDGDSAAGNGNYFAGRIVTASAHYFVDDGEIVQSVPDEYTAWSVGGSKWNNGGGRLYGVVTNSNSISIELCDAVRNGVVYPTEKTIDNALDLVRELMRRYMIPADHVIRHYDVNGKTCPAYWVDDEAWKSCFWDRINEQPEAEEEDGHEPWEGVEMKKLKSGMTGKAVKVWQVIVGAEVTGVFDVQTVKKTKAWKKKRGLDDKGAVGQTAWRVALEELATQAKE